VSARGRVGDTLAGLDGRWRKDWRGCRGFGYGYDHVYTGWLACYIPIATAAICNKSNKDLHYLSTCLARAVAGLVRSVAFD
jgi:hypothetical protein